MTRRSQRSDHADRLPQSWVLGLLGAALLARLLFIVLVPFFIRPDEVFQFLEPAHRLVTGQGAVTWEWHAHIRSWLLPGVIAPILWVSAALGFGHSIEAVQSVLAVASLGLVYAAIRFGETFGGRPGGLFCGVLMAFWPDPMLFGTHTLSEIQGGNLLDVATLAGTILLARERVSWTAWFGIGLLLGLAIILRFHLIPGVLPLLAFAVLPPVRQHRTRAVPMLLLGLALPVLGQAILDDLTLGSPLQSMWKNFDLNIGKGAAATYGVMSPLFYPARLSQLWGASTVPVLVCFVFGFRIAPLPAITALVVIAAHSAVGHKEFSFIYAALPLMLMVAGLGATRLLARYGWTDPRSRTIAAFVMLASGLLTTLSGYKPIIREGSDFVGLARDARSRPDLCGEAQYVGSSEWWALAGGYSVLDRNVPIYLIRSPAAFAESAPGFNVVIANKALLPTLPTAYRQIECLHEMCLLQRDASCRQTPINLLESVPGLGLQAHH